MPVSERTYQQVALEDPEGKWELHRGRLREKPGMTFGHQRVGWRLALQIGRQLDEDAWEVRLDQSRVRHTDETYYIPDVMVFPVRFAASLWDRQDMLEVYDAPLPFVAEVWSPSTGGYDVDTKLPEYRRRGDVEIWRLHPFERTVTAWRRRADGGYDEEVLREGRVRLVALPDVTVDLDRLFALPPLPPSR